MTFPTFFVKTKPMQKLYRAEHVLREYFDASWELWRREMNRALWDWAIDGPFCKDQNCGQRLEPVKDPAGVWQCIRCHSRTVLPQNDLVRLRNHIIRVFEEEVRHAEMQKA